MMNSNANLRKAAVFMRTLDAETAARMLAQLSPDEAAVLRGAVRAVGPLDLEEQADVVAEFRSARPIAAQSAAVGVELSLTSTGEQVQPSTPAVAEPAAGATVKRFEFLEKAPIEALIPYLSREHVQTIAVVLSYLPPSRAAAVVAALPEKLQSGTLERLAALGETDPESVVVVERELASWLARRTTCRGADVRRNETVAAILDATDALTRSQILANLRGHKREPADKLGRSTAPQSRPMPAPRKSRAIELSHQAAACAKRLATGMPTSLPQSPPPQPTVKRRPTVATASRPEPVFTPAFDDLIHLDSRTLAEVLREVDVNVLVLALAGSHEELAHRVCEQVPKRVARAIRRQLRQLGPTRLSDVEDAQRTISQMTAKHIASRRSGPLKVAAV